MTPTFAIASSGSDLTALYMSRLISLTVTDQSTEQADSLTVELSNRDGKLALPSEGEILSVSIGYVGRLRKMGEFVVDSVSLQGPPDTVTLSGKAAPFAAAAGFKPFQTRKTRSWDKVTLGNLVRTIAGEAGLSAAVSPEFDGWLLQHLDQTNESDMNLLTRLARDWRAVMKPTFGKLVFVKRGEAKSVSGLAVGGVTIDRADCSSYSASIALRTKFAKVRTRFHDPEKGKAFRVTAAESGDASVEEITPDLEDNDGETAVYEHPLDYPDQMGAEQAAKSILDQTQRGSESISVTLPGRPDIIAEGNVTLTGFHSRMNGEWCIKTVSHQFSKSGFMTTVQGEAPGGEAGAKKKAAAAKKAAGGSAGNSGGAFVE